MTVLWDIRVHPDFRNRGLGTESLKEVIAWSKKRHCKDLIIETQNINVPACKFYTKMGCKLPSFDILAYPEIDDEVQLIWHLKL